MPLGKQEMPVNLGDMLVVIARWESLESHEITLQGFIIEGHSVIPIFLDDDSFRAEVAGSGFEGQGVAVKRSFLAAMLKGDERLILNPGSLRMPLSKADLEVGHIPQ